ncbi:Glycosyltransferases involved in cell wall biogenesis [Methanocella conradii HZ254]|uniref:Glycosyltransferases involved in cell wall biogenesis n=1 Tax=Methanocella conradii (strain DSM 24694 / JCM 17849 / CGMCC 1.5162 / HZ254) TaxID=1041930 RepID=H8I8C4_METCZ|nr:S-layer glycoprotein N-glycosyltransferase AglJ [Methanocella conradii]AFC98977.1 Glycosyltransferases involved in cell wall biogenesis [Methanocella conradii HZ254]MDI6896778.1 S-layer glycoprotein N-glycosyltransferase AglJ [Methanocella conradii]
MKDGVCILIPTLNEEKTIGDLVARFKRLGYEDVLVIDGNSSDNTVQEAKAAGARVVMQDGCGKGRAIQQAFAIIDKDITVMIDGDGTYLPEEVDKLVEPIASGRADHVMGNRFANYEKGAFTRLNLLGNKILNKLFNIDYKVRLEDILTGYRAFNKKAIKVMDLNQSGFGIEVELTVESIKKDLRILEVPISYRARAPGAPTKLKPLEDGFKIGYTIYKLGKTYNPMLYLSLIGAAFVVAGLVVGSYVTIDWFKGINHLPLTVLTALLTITGVQIFIFGYLSDMIVQLQREMLRELRKR